MCRFRIRLFWTALSLATASAAGAAPQDDGLRPGRTWDEAHIPVDALTARLEAAVQSTVLELGDAARIEVETVDLRATPDSLAGLSLDGVGRIRIAGGEWIPLRFAAGYDVASDVLSGLRLQPIASTARLPQEGVDARVLDQVDALVAARLAADFPAQMPEVVVAELVATSAGVAHEAFRGLGWVRFDDEGQVPLRFTAIVDRRRDALLTFDYALEVLEPHGEVRTDALAAVQ